MLHLVPAPQNPTPTLDQRIEGAQRDIAKQEVTIKKLMAGGHEVDDASRYLASMLENLTALLQFKTDAASIPRKPTINNESNPDG